MASKPLKALAGLASVVAVLGYCAAFYFLSLSLREIPLGVAYAVWSGLGTVGSVLLGVLVWREALGPAHFAGIGPIVAGVVVLNVFAGNPGE